MGETIQVTDTIAIPRSEVVYRTSRSGGAGGQHVNTSSTRVELLWDFDRSSVLSDTEKARLRSRLARRLDAGGWLRIVSDNRRSQLQNRLAADERLGMIVRQALHIPKPRKPTRPTKGSKESRLAEKKRRSEIKGNRRRDAEYD